MRTRTSTSVATLLAAALLIPVTPGAANALGSPTFAPAGLLRAAIVDPGDVPADRIPPNGWDDAVAFSTSGWTVLDVTNASQVGAANVLPVNSPGVDAAAKVEAIIAATSGNRILHFPAGDYYLKSRLNITTSNIMLRGAGKGATHLNIVADAAINANIDFRGPGMGTTYDVTNLPTRGAQSVTVSTPSAFNVGDFAHIFDPAKVPTTSYPDFGTFSTHGQIVRITAKSGSTLTLDMKLGLDFNGDPKIAPMTMLSRVGARDLSIIRDRAADFANLNNLNFVSSFDVAVDNVESSWLEQGGIAAALSKKVLVINSDVHDAYDYGVGGQAYGIKMGLNTTQCRVTNNKLWNLRHHILLDRGANHCVISYNSAQPGYFGTTGDLSIHGFSPHNNLFEGNMGRDIKWDGRADANANEYQGLYNMAYRNRTTAFANNRITIQDPDAAGNLSQFRPTIIGNLTQSIAIESGVVGRFVGGNTVNGSFTRGQMPTGAVYPTSLYEDAQPTFLQGKGWPVFGPGAASSGATTTLPAFDRPKVDTPRP